MNLRRHVVDISNCGNAGSPVDDRHGRIMIFVNSAFPQGANGQICSESRGQEAGPEPWTY